MMIRVIPYASITFMTFDRYQTLYTELLQRETDPIVRLVSGASAGATATAFTYPLDLMRARMATDSARNPRYAGGYTRAFHDIIAKEGFMTLYRTLGWRRWTRPASPGRRRPWPPRGARRATLWSSPHRRRHTSTMQCCWTPCGRGKRCRRLKPLKAPMVPKWKQQRQQRQGQGQAQQEAEKVTPAASTVATAVPQTDTKAADFNRLMEAAHTLMDAGVVEVYSYTYEELAQRAARMRAVESGRAPTPAACCQPAATEVEDAPGVANAVGKQWEFCWLRDPGAGQHTVQSAAPRFLQAMLVYVGMVDWDAVGGSSVAGFLYLK
eukprot:GGOE01034204.1.p1 GENE.GGOE01034204.1~~GGOE01034204.1.p1  ORF type:complete len:323 (+),score=56.08 GGOE01034204.1:636-1604(+)